MCIVEGGAWDKRWLWDGDVNFWSVGFKLSRVKSVKELVMEFYGLLCNFPALKVKQLQHCLCCMSWVTTILLWETPPSLKPFSNPVARRWHSCSKLREDSALVLRDICQMEGQCPKKKRRIASQSWCSELAYHHILKRSCFGWRRNIQMFSLK